jgi:hypothetical protein
MAYRLLASVVLSVQLLGFAGCGDRTARHSAQPVVSEVESGDIQEDVAEPVYALSVSPRNPAPGQIVRILATGGKKIARAKIDINGPSGNTGTRLIHSGDGLPCWRIDEFTAPGEGKYQIDLIDDKRTVTTLQLTVSTGKPSVQAPGVIWKTEKGWDAGSEALYSAWINALFYEADERSNWPALHEVMQNRERNFLFSSLGLDEDDPAAKTKVIMEPDCADNPFYLRAYFAWKMGLPFGYHECDRGYLGKAPSTGRWITNESPSSRPHPVAAFNAFMRRLMDGVHSGTARTAFKDENADYYPVPLTRNALRPGVVFADPYGHTLILVRWVPPSGGKPGILLSVDAQPDGTVAVKRFWKGNFLFTTSEVVGEPGFKAFRPIVVKGDQRRLLKNEEISSIPGLIPFSMNQRSMESATFYRTMERIINPDPLDPETALLDLIQALHEQLIVRVNSVGNGEAYMKAHPGEVVQMPGKAAGVFQAGGQWEDFSTPNRDLRLLIAMDAVQEFPGKVVTYPDDYKMPKLRSAEQVGNDLRDLLAKRAGELTITYTRTNGTEQVLTMLEILARKEAFEMAYNPNDGAEIRWGAPEGSEERSSCRRQVPAWQLEKMKEVRVWFRKRLHPPT